MTPGCYSITKHTATLNRLVGYDSIFFHFTNYTSSVKTTGCQWWACQSWCSLAHANWAAQCWAWSLFLTVWSETCTPVACWRSFCRDLAVPPRRYWSCYWVDEPLQACTALLVYRLVYWYLLHAAETVLQDLGGLDYLCNLIGLQVAPHATISDMDTIRTQN